MITTTAKNRQLVQALRYSDTELFDHLITGKTYQDTRTRLGGPRTFYGPQTITPELFAALYTLARSPVDTRHP